MMVTPIPPHPDLSTSAGIRLKISTFMHNKESRKILASVWNVFGQTVMKFTNQVYGHY